MNEDAGELLARLARIPDSAREFTVSTTKAVADLRLSTELIDSLVARGLRHRQTSDGLRFDASDLKNISMRLGASSSMLAARRFWAAGLTSPAGVEERQSIICYQPRCPAPGHPGPCSFRLATPGGVVDRVSASGDPGTLHEETVTIPTRWPALPGPYGEVLAAVAGLDFMFLPAALRTDLDFARRAGMCACEGTAQMLVAEAARRGLPARSRFGLIVAPPYSTVHTWAEFPVGDRWVPVDPVLLRSMIGWRILDPAAWHEGRSIGPVVAAIGDRPVPLATHGDRIARLTLSTRRVRPAAAGRPSD
jgi:hypothetical protein